MFTEEDLSALTDDYRQIENYVKQNYAARLSKRESIIVRFGEPEEANFLSFSRDYIRVTCNSQTYSFGVDVGFKNVYACQEGAVPLILNWNSVKMRIENEFNERESKRKAIRDFCV